MNKDIKYTVEEHWKIPTEQLPIVYELVQKYGIDLIHENLDWHDVEYTKEYFEDLETRVKKDILFEAKDWDQMYSILNEIFQFGELESFGLFDIDDLFTKIDRNRLMYFYEFKEDKTNKKVIACRGSKVSDAKQGWIMDGYQKWLKHQRIFE